MSHQPERKEKNCLNCGTTVQGRYCQQCGQENIIPHQNFWALTSHFIFDIFHFDGKFFDTLKHLFFRPGRVPLEYIAGKRMKYLDPIRMYLFTSAIFFLVFFGTDLLDIHPTGSNRLSRSERMEFAMELHERQKKNEVNDLESKLLSEVLLDSTRRVYLEDTARGPKDSLVTYKGKLYRMVVGTEREGRQDSVKPKGNWLSRTISSKIADVDKRSEQNQELPNKLIEVFLHRLPYILFFSLPFFALILKLLYSRRKNFLYSDHAIFTLYHYIFSLLLLLMVFGMVGLTHLTNWQIWSSIARLLLFSWAVYLYIGMRRFYKQGFGKTLLKFILLNLIGLVVLFGLLFLFFLITLIQF